MVFQKGNKLAWKGGKKIEKGRYTLILRKDHRFTNSQGYVREHRLVYEESRACCLLPWTIVHHKDGNVHNNTWNNLEAMTQKIHAKNDYHRKRQIDNRGRLC